MPNPNIKDPLVPKQDNSALDSLPEVDWRSRLRITATNVTATYTTETIAEMLAKVKPWNAPQYCDSLLAIVRQLLAENAELRFWKTQQDGWIKDVEEREAACCPEDVGFDEYIHTLLAERDTARSELTEIRSAYDVLQTHIEEAIAQGTNRFRTRVLELVRKKAEEYEADTVGPEGRANSYYASRSSARARAARELEKEIGELK
jgi:hypothetical protein